jgi:hypothetical protein
MGYQTDIGDMVLEQLEKPVKIYSPESQGGEYSQVVLVILIDENEIPAVMLT